jgi:tetratricopeptide (TPR) repeat protein
MALRIGRHGGLCFILDDRAALSAISDGTHRKDAVPFQEVTLPADESGRTFEARGPSFARQLGAAGRYAEIDRRIAELGLAFRMDPAGFEQEHSSVSVPRRDLHYHELDTPGAAAITLDFVLEEPFRWEVSCAGLRVVGNGFELPSSLHGWISAAQPVRHDGDRLWIDLPAGTHSVLLIVLSRHTGVELHDTALIVRPEDAVVAAVAQLSVRGLIPILPAVSEKDMREAGAVLADLGVGRAVVVDALADQAGALNLGDDGVVVITTSDGTDWPRDVAAALDPDSDTLAVDLGPDPARTLYERLADPEPDAGLVVCDSTLPCVRVIAAAYAALAGYALTLLDVEEEPVAPPDWSASHHEPLQIRIERYRVALAEQARRLIAPRLPPAVPSVAVVFTRGYAYSLLRGAHGPWAGEVELGVLPDGQAPALLLRALGHGAVSAPRFGVSLIVDALAGPGHEAEYATVHSSASATVVRPVGLNGPDATAAAVRGAIAGLPVDLITLICHGERDFVELADGPLTADEVATWRLPNAPVLVNNSCGSWHTTGAAFVTAGARAYVGTLWPVETRAAAQVSAALVRALTSTAEVRVGGALRDALNGSADVEYDVRFAYVLVGLPTVPARLAPVLDSRQRSEIAEHGLRTVYIGAGRLARSGEPTSALFLRTHVITALLEELRTDVDADELGGYLDVHNVAGGQLDALAATYESLFWSDMAAAGGATVDDAISACERAVEAWEEVLRGDQGITPLERRPKVVAGLLAQLTELQFMAGRVEHAWRTAMRTTAALTNPAEPVPAEPSDVDNETIVDAAGLLPQPSSYLNAVGLIAAAHGRSAEQIYFGALRYATDPGDAGRIRSNLAKLHLESGRLAEAEAGFNAALPLLREAGDDISVGITRAHVARLLLDQNDVHGAETLARELTSTLPHDTTTPTGAWQDADSVLIRALVTTGRFTEAADRATERHRIACAAGDAVQAWQALAALLDLRLKSVVAGADLTTLTEVVRAAAATVTAFSADPSPLRTKIADLLATNRQLLLAALGEEADMLMEVLTDLRAIGSSPAERRALVEHANSWAALAQVEKACKSAPWMRECVVWLSPSDGRTRSMIFDRPPSSLSAPAYIRYPTIASSGVTVTDAFVEKVDCWARTRSGVAYRYDGTPGLIVIEKVGLVRTIRHGHRYRDVWGSRRFLYHVTVTLPEPAILTAVDIRLRSLGLSPRVGIGRHGQSMTVVLDPNPLTDELLQRDPIGVLDKGWLATVTIEFTDFPPVHEVLIEQLDEDQLVPLSAYNDVMNRFGSFFGGDRP